MDLFLVLAEAIQTIYESIIKFKELTATICHLAAILFFANLILHNTGYGPPFCFMPVNYYYNWTTFLWRRSLIQSLQVFLFSSMAYHSTLHVFWDTIYQSISAVVAIYEVCLIITIYNLQDVLVPWHRPETLSTPSLELTSTTATSEDDLTHPPYNAYTHASDTESCR